MPLRRSPVRPRRVTLLLERTVPPTGSLTVVVVRVWVCAEPRVSVAVVVLPLLPVLRRVCVVAELPVLSRVVVVVVVALLPPVLRRAWVVLEEPLLRVSVVELPPVVEPEPVWVVVRRICEPEVLPLPLLLPEVARRTGVMLPE